MPTFFEIHPSVGVARVGDSTQPDGFNLAPEPGQAQPASFRDATGLKRQAARSGCSGVSAMERGA
jgi:hypothetical protein